MIREAHLRSLTLDTAIYQAREGIISREEWEWYAHLWQTSAPRFALRACHCDACRAAYPDSEGYRSPGPVL